jgi:hypothetical protein
VCRFHVAAGEKLHADKFHGAIVWSVAKLADINLQKFGSFSYWFDKPWFHNWGKTYCCAHHNLLLGFSNKFSGVNYAPGKQQSPTKIQVFTYVDDWCVPILPQKVGSGYNTMIRVKRIYNFWCSMLFYTPFALCFVTLRGIFMHFPKLTYKRDAIVPVPSFLLFLCFRKATQEIFSELDKTKAKPPIFLDTRWSPKMR